MTVEKPDGGIADDATVAVSRRIPVDGDTVVVDRDAPSDDATVVVDRNAASEAPGKASPPRVPRGRQRINLPPVEPGFAEQAVLAVGPGASESYAPRGFRREPVAAAPVEPRVHAIRPPAGAVPSVRRASRRFGVIAIVGFAVACAVSVVGLTVIVVTMLRGL